jgi:hypothetical protein
MTKISRQALQKIRAERNSGDDLTLSSLFRVLFDTAMNELTTDEERINLVSARAKTLIIIDQIEKGSYQKGKKKTLRVL